MNRNPASLRPAWWTACAVLLVVFPPIPATYAAEADAMTAPSTPESEASPAAAFAEAAKREVVELHRFFEDWFHGRLPETDEAFARFADVMAPGMRFVTPGGELVERDTLVAGLRGGHGRWSGREATIEVRRVSPRAAPGDVQIVTYEEWQEIDGETRVRLSTAVFERHADAPNGVRWVHVHETWMAGQ